MAVYVEYVLINNFIANYCVLKLTVRFAVTTSKLKFWLSLIISVVAGTLTPLIPLVGVWTGLIKVVISMIIVAILTGKIQFKRYVVTFLVFYGVSFGVGGVVTALQNMLSFTGVADEVRTFYVLLGTIIFRYISVQALSYIKGRKARSEGITVFCGINGRVQATSFVDTGNTVTYKGSGVAFINKKLKDKLILIPTSEYITVTSVGGARLFEVYYAKISITDDTTKDIPIVFWDSGKFDVILYGGVTNETDTTYQKDTFKT